MPKSNYEKEFRRLKAHVPSAPDALRSTVLARALGVDGFAKLLKQYRAHSQKHRGTALDYTPTAEEIALYLRVVQGELTNIEFAHKLKLSGWAAMKLFANIGAHLARQASDFGTIPAKKRRGRPSKQR